MLCVLKGLVNIYLQNFLEVYNVGNFNMEVKENGFPNYLPKIDFKTTSTKTHTALKTFYIKISSGFQSD